MSCRWILTFESDGCLDKCTLCIDSCPFVEEIALYSDKEEIRFHSDLGYLSHALLEEKNQIMILINFLKARGSVYYPTEMSEVLEYVMMVLTLLLLFHVLQKR